MTRTAQRRHNDDRVLRRRLSHPYHWWVRMDERLNDKDRARWQGIYRTTGTTCSCPCCRVNRRHYGPSMQEKRQVAYMESV